MTNPSPRAAHRPSRRQVVIDAAMQLFSTLPVEEVTVVGIAAAAEVTPAAVYYHFASKEQILLEGVTAFCERLLRAGEAELAAAAPGRICTVVGNLAEWCMTQETAAVVYFVQSSGMNQLVEARRRETRFALVELLRQARTVESDGDPVEAGVIAAALVSLLETAAVWCLTRHATLMALGDDGFRRQVDDLAERIWHPLAE
jgi:AcrR family transcriptional regulator